MRRRLALSLLLAVAALAFAPAPLPRRGRPADPAPAMDGLWRGPNEMRVTADRVVFDGDPGFTYALSFDRAAGPAAYDVLSATSVEPQFVGIYKVEGDTLTVTFS